MKCFFTDHPVISLLIVATVCGTITEVTRLIINSKKQKVAVGVFNLNGDSEEHSEEDHPEEPSSTQEKSE